MNLNETGEEIPSEREELVRRLERIAAGGRRKAVPQLLEALKHPDAGIAFLAARLLQQLGGSWAVRGCLRLISRPGSAPHREAAAHALSFMDPIPPKDRARAAKVLMVVAHDPNDQPSVRAEALEALKELYDFGEFRDRRRVAGLILPLLRDPHPEVRFWAAFALGNLRCRFALPELDRVAATDREVCPGWWYVAEEAADAATIIRGGDWGDRVPVHLRPKEESGAREL